MDERTFLERCRDLAQQIADAEAEHAATTNPTNLLELRKHRDAKERRRRLISRRDQLMSLYHGGNPCLD